MQAKMAVARIKLLRNKRQAVVKQMRRDIALLLQSGQDATARIRVLNTFYYSFSYHSNLKFMAFGLYALKACQQLCLFGKTAHYSFYSIIKCLHVFGLICIV